MPCLSLSSVPGMISCNMPLQRSSSTKFLFLVIRMTKIIFHYLYQETKQGFEFSVSFLPVAEQHQPISGIGDGATGHGQEPPEKLEFASSEADRKSTRLNSSK